MNGRTARALRKANPTPEPQINPLSDEAESTRAEARKMKFRKKLHALELERSSPRIRNTFLAKWNAIYGLKRRPEQA